jgi:hypothetical protein
MASWCPGIGCRGCRVLADPFVLFMISVVVVAAGIVLFLAIW